MARRRLSSLRACALYRNCTRGAHVLRAHIKLDTDLPFAYLEPNSMPFNRALIVSRRPRGAGISYVSRMGVSAASKYHKHRIKSNIARDGAEIIQQARASYLKPGTLYRPPEESALTKYTQSIVHTYKQFVFSWNSPA